MDQVKTTHGSIDSLSHLSQCSSPRMEALSEDQFSMRSEDSRVKFMCSYGGRIMPRPHDCQLRYVGGETRLLVVGRNITLADLMAKLTRLCGKSVLLKFQLPDEDLDSLVSVLCEEDLENMMEEYDRLESRDASTRLRLFLFPVKSHSSSLDFHEYDSRNAEQRFVDAVNGFSRKQNSLPTSQGLPDFLFGLDVFEKQTRPQGAHPKANSQPIPRARSYHEGVSEKDQLSLQNSPPIVQPVANSQQEVAKLHQDILLDSMLPISNLPTVSVADHSLEEHEVIKQLSSLIPTPLDLQASEKKPSPDTVLGHFDEENNWPRNLQRKPELDSARELNLLSTSDYHPHVTTTGGLPTSPAAIDEKRRKDPLSIRVSAELRSPVESPAEVGRYVEGIYSNSQNSHLPKILHDLPVLYSEPDYFLPDLHSNAQKSKAVSNPVNGDVSTSLGVQKSERSTEFARKQQYSSDKQDEDGDQKNQKKGEGPSGDHTERYSYNLNTEGQQEINDKASRHIQEGYKAENSAISLMSSTVTQYVSNQQQNLQPNVVASNNTHAIQWQLEEDQMRQHIDDGAAQSPRTSAFQQQTVPGPSQFPPPSILRVASTSPPSKACDLPRSAHRHCMAAVPPQPAHLHRQLAAALPYSELQQQPFPLPRIKVGQPTTRDQTVPRASRVQSPSRFRDIPPSTPFQVQWLNSEERLQRTMHQPASGGTMLQSTQQDHYVDPSGHLLYDSSTIQVHYADHVNPSELAQSNPFQDELGHLNDQPPDSHPYQAAAGLLHHAREPQTGSAEGHRHAIHQRMKT